MTEDTKQEVVKEVEESKKENSPIAMSKKKLIALFVVGVLFGFMLGRALPSNSTVASTEIAANNASATAIIASEPVAPAPVAEPAAPVAVIAPASSPAMPDGE